jgi:three-Cys-motif partner protein
MVTFFDEQRDQSRVKTAIVTKYFRAWSRVIVPQAKKRGGKVGYIDLFAGRGVFGDGSKSTPLLILEMAVADPDLRNMLVTVLNDKEPEHVASLKEAIKTLPGVEGLKNQPTVMNAEVGEQLESRLAQTRFIPSLFFLDPCGYKGLTRRLIQATLKDWGCDCIVFFNYRRINMGLNNDLFREHMAAIFGDDRVDEIRAKLEPLSPEMRETTIIEEFAQTIRNMGGQYVLPFRFVDEHKARTSHHIVFISKNVLGYTIMKEIMAGESTQTDQGVPSFEYNPADARHPFLFELTRPLDELEGMLLEAFAGQACTMQQIFEAHQVGRRFIKRNYKDVLMQLEGKGKVVADPPSSKRRKGTFADAVQVTFPSKGS